MPAHQRRTAMPDDPQHCWDDMTEIDDPEEEVDEDVAD